MPVVRNPQFNFKEGLCWIFTLNECSEYQKARLKEKTVNDVNAMALYPIDDVGITSKYYVSLFNSYFIFLFKRIFINSSSAFQINDARMLPIVIPSQKQIDVLESIFERAVYIRKTTNDEFELNKIQQNLDNVVLDIYSLD